MKITSEILAAVKGLKQLNTVPFKGATGIESDSRAGLKKKVFIAFSGKNFDGHSFIETAVTAGAAAIIGETKKIKKFTGLKIPVFGCKNSILTYGAIGAECRRRFSGKVISMTGSAGKTSVKELIKLFAEQEKRVTATTANNNNHIGVPKTILGANESDEILVLECGTNHFGEIPYVAPIASPDIALITNIGDSHLEYLINRQGVLTEKRALLDAAQARGGIVVLNTDDPNLRKIKKDFTSLRTVSLKSKADYTLRVVKEKTSGERELLLQTPAGNFKLKSTILGDHSLMNIALSSAAVLEAGLSVKAIISGLAQYKAPKGRMSPELLPGKLLLIDDTYNANPDSMKAGLLVVKKLKAKKKFLILGDMFELGAFSKKAHTGLKKVIEEVQPTEVLLCGEAMKDVLKPLLKAGIKSNHFEVKEDALRYAATLNTKNSVVFVKGSRGMKMEVFTEYFRNRKGS